MPLRTPVAVLKVTPDGSDPVRASEGVGLPDAVTVKVPATPSVKTELSALVIAGPDGPLPEGPPHATMNKVKKTNILTEKNLFLQQTVREL